MNAQNNVTIVDDNIAWTSDVNFKFKNLEADTIPTSVSANRDWEEVQWLNMKDRKYKSISSNILEHFIVWMRTAGLPNFRKLWGKIPDNLKQNRYSVIIENTYDVESFSGSKSFVLSTTNALGGKNYFLAVCYIVVGTLCTLFAFIFCIAYMRKKNASGSGENA